MRWIAIFFLGVASALLAEPLSLAAQDQLVRPARVSLAPAGPSVASERAAGERAASERAASERAASERAALEREFDRYEARGENEVPASFEAQLSQEARPPQEARLPEEGRASSEAGGAAESHGGSFDSLSVPLKKRESGSERRAVGEGWFSGPIAKITGGLAVTLGLFAIMVVIARRGGGVNLRGLPREAFEVVGQTAIGPRQRLMVVRVGTQALVIGTSPAGIHRVAQIEDPDEAGQLIAQCRGIGSQAAFKSTLYELEQQRAAPGFVDDAPPPKSGSLFLRA